jgi:undecaprenyl-diphosphatase
MLILFFSLVVAFVSLTVLVMRTFLPINELSITRRVQSGAVWGLGPLLHVINIPGYPPQVFVLGVLLVVLPYLIGLKWIAITLAVVTLGVGLSARIVKSIAQRPRPAPEVVAVQRVLDQGTQSYPAGHCADYLARFGFIIYVLIQLAPPTWWAWLTILVLFVFIALVGLARIYSGEHWMTDVLGGYLLGGIWLLLGIWMYQWTDAQILVDRYL